MYLRYLAQFALCAPQKSNRLPALLLLSLLLSSLTLSGCQLTQKAADKQFKQATNQTKELTTAKAIDRAKRISNIEYQLTLDITQASQFTASSQINFELNETDKPLSLDLRQAQIKSFTLNGNKLYPNYDGSQLILSPRLLKKGSNSVTVTHKSSYSHTTNGLHQYIDPLDGQRYLSSHFKPASTQGVFALFDQLDLKASIQLEVIAPDGWQVISTALEQTRVQVEGNKQQWHFAPTANIAPSSLSLHAGPYRVWRDNSSLPIRLLARQSMAASIDAPLWFELSRKTITEFEQVLHTPYPFTKLDHILIPELDINHQRSAATLSYSESLLPPTNIAKTLPPVVSPHKVNAQLTQQLRKQVAHQWFGEYVTVKFSREQWLTDSLASYLSLEGRQEITPAALSLQQNQQLTSLIQLKQQLGKYDFKLGITGYLARYAYGNSSFTGFIDQLSTTTKQDLSYWYNNGFTSTKLNTIEARFHCKNNKIENFTLIQTPNKNSSIDDTSSQTTTDKTTGYQQQSLNIAIYTQGRKQLHLIRTLPITYSGQFTQVDKLQGVRCPALVLPNYQNGANVRVKLDHQSLNTTKQQLYRIENPRQRMMLWQNLWDAVTAGELPLNNYLDTVFINLTSEQNSDVLQTELTRLAQVKRYLELMQPSHQHYKNRVLKAFEQMSFRGVLQSKNRNQQLWLDSYLHFSHSRSALSHLKQLVNNHHTIQGLSLSQPQRWQAIIQLSRHNHSASQQLIEDELMQDSSEQGKLFALAATVSGANTLEKQRWLNKVIVSNSLTTAEKKVVISHLYPTEQQLSDATAQQRLSFIKQLALQPVDFIDDYLKYLLPKQCSHTGVLALQKLISNNDLLASSRGTEIQAGVTQLHQQMELCVRIRDNLII